MRQAPGRGLTLGLGARQRRGLSGEGEHATFEIALGEEQHAEYGEHQHEQPAEDGWTVHGQGALGHDLAHLGI